MRRSWPPSASGRVPPATGLVAPGTWGERIGLRLAFRQAQDAAGDITLLFADESEAPAKQGGHDGRPGRRQQGVDRAHIAPTKHSADFVALLEEIDRRFVPRPDRTAQEVILVR